MRITRIERQKKKRGRVSIYVDDEFAIGISEETLLKEGLRTGDDLSDERLRQIRREESYTQARLAALHLLAIRPRSVSEISDRLRRKEYPEADIRQVVFDLRKTGMLDDARFAAMVVRDLLSSSPSGPRLLKAKLRRYGIGRELAGKAIEAGFRELSEESCAGEAAAKYLRTRARRTDDLPTLRNRLSAFLSRRGFTWEVIRPVINSLLSDQERAGDE